MTISAAGHRSGQGHCDGENACRADSWYGMTGEARQQSQASHQQQGRRRPHPGQHDDADQDAERRSPQVDAVEAGRQVRKRREEPRRKEADGEKGQGQEGDEEGDPDHLPRIPWSHRGYGEGIPGEVARHRCQGERQRQEREKLVAVDCTQSWRKGDTDGSASNPEHRDRESDVGKRVPECDRQQADQSELEKQGCSRDETEGQDG
jgi:hypothetical protein